MAAVTARLSVVQYWDTDRVPDYLDEPISSFPALNPEMGHLLFSERTAAEFIDAHFGPREVAAFAACAVPTMQSDYFRYCATHVLGGAYVDVGFRCVAPLRPLFEPGGGTLFRRDPPGFLLSGFFLFASPGHPLPRLVIDVVTRNIERRSAERVQMVTGPWILSGLSLLHRLGGEERHAGALAERGLAALAEPFRREAAAVVPTASARRLVGPMAASLIAAVGEYGRLAEAFAQTRIAPYETALECIREPQSPLPYKESERYWVNWQRRRSIFR